ncbi:hypothetical protein [Nocardia puris]|uniref:hypothetical protein n=1 Tax=Nocardia puris TaxID=208602 RepID=UPI002E239203
MTLTRSGVAAVIVAIVWGVSACVGVRDGTSGSEATETTRIPASVGQSSPASTSQPGQEFYRDRDSQCLVLSGQNIDIDRIRKDTRDLESAYEELRREYATRDVHLAQIYDPGAAFKGEDADLYKILVGAVPAGGMARYFEAQCALPVRMIDVVARAKSTAYPSVADGESLRREVIALWERCEYLSVLDGITTCIYLSKGGPAAEQIRMQLEEMRRSGTRNPAVAAWSGTIENLCPTLG